MNSEIIGGIVIVVLICVGSIFGLHSILDWVTIRIKKDCLNVIIKTIIFILILLCFVIMLWIAVVIAYWAIDKIGRAHV